MRIRKAVSALSIALLLGAMTPARSQEQDAKKNLDSSASSAMQKRVIVGVVKDYEAGKSLTVTTRDKDVEMFKLDDTNINLQLNTSLIVGQAVKSSNRRIPAARGA